MSTWTSGYVADIDYIHGYYRDLSPTLLNLAALNRNVGVRSGRPFRYLELGFGQGLSLNIHAAACPGEFWGTDFNPAQASHALEMSEAGGTGAKIFDQSFAEFAARDDLPEFDMITLHGIWSWISDENRAVIVDLARRKLAVGGALYISYNTTPGWSAAIPLRHLITLHADLAGSDDQGIAGKIDGALAFAQQVVDSGAMYFKANPAVVERLKSITKQDRHYVAHEFFNRDWDPMPFSRVAELLSGAKLSFAASTNLLDHVDSATLTPEWQTLLAGITHPVLRESVRDYLVSQQFRKDVFVKGGRTIQPLEQFERYRTLGFVLLIPADEVPLKVKGGTGEIRLQDNIYTPLLDMLSENSYAPKTVGELLAHPRWGGKPVASLTQALVILTGSGHICPVQDADAIKTARPRSKQLNTYLCQQSRFSRDINYLASPVVGGGITVPRFHQLFLLARQSGRQQPEAWAAFVWETLNMQGQKIVKDGKALETAEENIAELTVQAKAFGEKRLPILKALGVAA